MRQGQTYPSSRQPFAYRLIVQLARGRPMGPGALLFVAHRVSGLLITIYLFFHLATLRSVLQGPQAFDRTMALMNSPGVRLLELGLVAVVLFHMINGLRLTVVALFPWTHPRSLAYAVLALVLVLVAASLPAFLR